MKDILVFFTTNNTNKQASKTKGMPKLYASIKFSKNLENNKKNKTTQKSVNKEDNSKGKK